MAENQKKNYRKVVIMGGGPAGLAVGWKLIKNDVQVEVIELENQVGGLSRSIRRNGFIFDLGGHRFISKYKELLRDVGEIMGETIELRPRKSQIRLKGKYFAYPLDVKDLVTKMNAFVSIKCFVDYVYTFFKNKIAPKEDVSLEDWIVNRFGRSLYDIYFGPYSEKLWGIPPTQISADWAAQRISLINLWDVFKRLFGKTADTPTTYATEFFYPKEGIGQIPERMAEIITEGGGTVHLNTEVVRVKAEGNMITGVVVRKNGREETITGDFYVSTIPLPEFVMSLDPPVEEKYQEAAGRMRFRALRFMNILIDGDRLSDNTWIYIPEDEYLFFRIQEPKNWGNSTVPEGKTSLILEIACDVGDDLWEAHDDDIIKRCIGDLKKLGFDIEGRIDDYFSMKVKHAYPIYDINYIDKLKVAFELFMRYDNLAVCGRQGLYRYNNMDHSMMMGYITANHVLNGVPRSEILKIACEREVFETHAISSY
jgi:protoporphyrinogen oxidase